MRISDWSSDVCSSDLPGLGCREQGSQGLVAFEQERHAFGVGGEFWGFAAGGFFGGEVGGVHGLVELLVGLDQGGRHGQRVVEVGEGGVREFGTRVQYELGGCFDRGAVLVDRKSTRLNSSH